jgi:putative ABC transport system ATP-binding protein
MPKLVHADRRSGPADRREARRALARSVGKAQEQRVLVRIENVSKDYRLGNQLVPALKRINLNIDEGVFMAIAGPSGSGKSTLLNLIGCIDMPTSGRIVIADHDISSRNPDQLAALRARTIGFIFQTFNLLPVLSAEENVEYPLLQMKELTPAERQRRVRRYLEVVGLSKFARHRPNQLSGGQRQRVAIARALAVHPKIILADEPTANLDHKTGKRILRLMRGINRRTGTTFVFSTHDKRVIDMADRRVDLEDGEIARLAVRKATEWIYAMERMDETDSNNEEGVVSGKTRSRTGP